ncbi:anti-sigma factor family protein [Burkholderia latens]|uniref:Anti-sigma factor n=1 Tax=Burkholderia latens TaxID=488446 RepID=A0A6H9SMG0_9BURK|nr:anti-sigma factor [Burkholderia latens]KAB0634208.1 anti-sigma factor [Burkholderia latens]VWB25892.1 anti-sigma factor [Burkholderia latens]
MTMDDILLMAYADGELAPHQREEVDRAIGVSADVARRVALFEASVLPYRRAFEQQTLPPVPPGLVRAVAEIAQAYAAPPERSARGDARHMVPPMSAADTGGPPPVRARARARQMAPCLAAAFVAGAFSCGAILHLASGVEPRGAASQAAAPIAQTTTSPWIMAAVNYQQLYTRDTVAFDPANPAAAAHTIDNIRRDDGLRIHIPDLRAVGLTFKRIQRLNFNHKPLVQIVYLPDKGLPVALCVMKDERPDTVPTRQQVGSMDVVTWRRARITYALIATPGDTDLSAIGKRITDSGTEEVLGLLSRDGAAVAS